MKKEKRSIGLIGYGVVGRGFVKLLRERYYPIEIISICVKNLEKQREKFTYHFTSSPDELLDNPNIDTIVEAIDDATVAYQVVVTAMKSGKDVVSANKKMIAEHFHELIMLQKKQQVTFLYDASVCADIPVIRNLETYYNSPMLQSLEGICNGSCNYILTQMAQQGLAYEKAVVEAQQLGFAETDPYLDVSGLDTKYKLTILLGHAHGVVVSPSEIFHAGIDCIKIADLDFAKKGGRRVKLIAQTITLNQNRVVAFCMPTMVDQDHRLYEVSNENNGVILEMPYSEQQALYGKGAGEIATGSALLADTLALTNSYSYNYTKHMAKEKMQLTTSFLLKIYMRYKSRQDIEALHFSQIIEQGTWRNEPYVIGEINLEELIKKKKYLGQNELFIAHIK